MASILNKGLKEANCKFFVESKSNQVFPILSNESIKKLEEKFSFNIWEKVDNKNSAIRLVTSWATKKRSGT